MRHSPAAAGPFVTDEPHRIGSGWLSGTLGAVLGLAGLAAAACLAWPDALTTPALRAHYPPGLRQWVAGGLALALLLGLVSLALRRKKTLGTVALASAVLGLAGLQLPGGVAQSAAPWLAVDAFVLNLLVYPAVFLPIERLWPRRDQPTFRVEWWTDLAWFVSSALLVHVMAWAVPLSGRAVADLAPAAQRIVASLPVVAQLLLAVFVADLVQYWAHRASHRIPLLWRFHAIHHSATAMDWLAGSRLHLVDALLTRALVFAAITLLGFDAHAVALYVVWVAAQATFVHANVSWRLTWLEPWLATPRFHHWHHAQTPVDVNFAVHLPWLDRLFGTHYLPAQDWPPQYGLSGGASGPRGFWRQLLAPFRP